MATETNIGACGCCAAQGGNAFCCSRTLNDPLYASLSGGEGSMTMPWNGSNYWQGSKALTCGETLHLRYSGATCLLEYSCNGSAWITAGRDGTPLVCGPPFSDGIWSCNMDNTMVGCVAGSCGTITATITE